MLAPSRRRLVFWAVLRGVLTAAALVVLYYVLPLDQPWNGDTAVPPWNGGTAVRILIGLLVFAGIAVWQVRSIIGSRYPRIRAFEALGLILPFYLLVFASTYFVLQRASAASFTQPLTRTRGPLRAMRRQCQRSSCAIWSRTAVTASISAGSCPGATSTP